MISHLAAHLIGDLPRLVERATHQQHAELIAAEAADEVGIAHRAAHQLGDVAQQTVAGQVTARVVDHLEAVQIQITQHVGHFAALGRIDTLLQPALEFAAVDQPGERIVGRLVGDLPRQPARLGHVVQHQHGTAVIAIRLAQRRRGDLHQALVAPPLAEQQGPAAEIHGRPGADGLAHGLGQELAVRLGHIPGQLLHLQAARALGIEPKQFGGRRIDVVDLAAPIDGHQGSGHGLQRGTGARARPADAQRGHGLGRQYLHPDEQERGMALVLDGPGAELQPRVLALQSQQIDLIALGGGLARQALADISAYEFREFRRHQILEAPAHQLGRGCADELGELRIGVGDAARAVYQHRFMQVFAQRRDRRRRGHLRIRRGAAGTREQVIDDRDQRGELALIGVQFHATAQGPAHGYAVHLARKFLERTALAALQPMQCQQQQREQSEQQTK